MRTSIDSLKLAVSWKESQVKGAKFTVKVCFSLKRHTGLFAIYSYPAGKLSRLGSSGTGKNDVDFLLQIDFLSNLIYFKRL